MNIEEIKEAIDYLRFMLYLPESNQNKLHRKSLTLAIEALEKQEKYQEFFRDLFNEESTATFKVVKESDTK